MIVLSNPALPKSLAGSTPQIQNSRQERGQSLRSRFCKGLAKNLPAGIVKPFPQLYMICREMRGGKRRVERGERATAKQRGGEREGERERERERGRAKGERREEKKRGEEKRRERETALLVSMSLA